MLTLMTVIQLWIIQRVPVYTPMLCLTVLRAWCNTTGLTATDSYESRWVLCTIIARLMMQSLMRAAAALVSSKDDTKYMTTSNRFLFHMQPCVCIHHPTENNQQRKEKEKSCVQYLCSLINNTEYLNCNIKHLLNLQKCIILKHTHYACNLTGFPTFLCKSGRFTAHNWQQPTAYRGQKTRENLALPVLLIGLSGESRELTDTVTKESSFPSLAANSSQLIQFPPALSDSAHDCI